jgi:hypothetical protein
MKDLRKIQEFFSKPTDDKIDTITMDIPLFIRSLEYAREDAKDDMDLHNMAEKAIKGTKQKGILSMVDYDNLTQQKIKEVIQQVISEEKTKRDRCLRIADRKFDKPSAYKSGAVVRCRKGKIWKKLKEEILSNLTTIEPYNDPDDEYSQDLDSYLKDDNIDWKKESYITLLNPNQIQPSEWNSLSDDPQNLTSVKYSKIDPSKFPPILALKTGPNSYEAIDGIHRVYAFRLNNHMIPAIVISPKLKQGLSTDDTQMVNFMFNKYEDNNIPTPTKINNLQEIGDAGSKIYPYSSPQNKGKNQEYTFETDSGLNYVVKFHKFEFSPLADVSFYFTDPNNSSQDKSYINVHLNTANKGEVFSVMSTITQIVKDYLNDNPDMNALSIMPTKDSSKDNRRFNLYMAYIKQQLDPSQFDVEIDSIGDIEITRKNTNSENLDPTSFKDDNKSSPYGSGYTKIKEDISSKIKTYKIPYKEFNIEIKDRIKEWKNEYGNDTALINEMVARNLLYKIAQDLFGGVNEIDFANKAKNPTNYFQMVMYLGNMILWTSPFIYVDNNHKVITSKTKIKVLDEDYEDLAVLKEDESLNKWFKRQGPSGKEGGWVDCNTCRTTDGKTKCKACGRKKGEKRSKYPSCRPTAAKCKDKGKGKTWGKTK